MPAKAKYKSMRSMERVWITRKGEKSADTVNGKELDCPQRRKMGRRGRWRESGLPAKEKKAQTRSKEVNWIARKGEKSADTVKGNELDCPQR
ncbi:hypothetical protein [Neobacillus mesonae]|uniref:hypothetical protein n=1 Tax=Neobacillus mesonae TaxID=1193713 RepID=UPI00203CEBB4|nr:hypothetical protein [Neobacillus mesonae]MCM3569777.1 hypothetical protein [Neobacillus mesonae]